MEEINKIQPAELIQPIQPLPPIQPVVIRKKPKWLKFVIIGGVLVAGIFILRSLGGLFVSEVVQNLNLADSSEQVFDGEEAIAKLETINPKPMLIILDVMMPKMSGFDVLKHVKASPDLKSIPVIMLSNLAGQEDAEKALGMGAVLYLVKSQYEPKQIVDKIKEIVAASSRKDSIPEVKVPTKDIK